ncbi:anti-sigma factor family protein [Streptomyces hypolithicus]
MSPKLWHFDVGAYALGVLDPADTFRFEEHLAECATCAVLLGEFAVVESALAAYARPGGGVGGPSAERPAPALLERLLAGVEAGRRRSAGRRMRLVAVAAALIVTGPVLTLGLQQAPGPGDDEVMRYAATDSATGVSASVAVRGRAWGSGVGLELAGVRGPLTCSLVAVGTTGEEQTVATWSVPAGGYGIPGVPGHEEPLRTEGGAALRGGEIDRFEVRTRDGERLVTVEP